MARANYFLWALLVLRVYAKHNETYDDYDDANDDHDPGHVSWHMEVFLSSDGSCDHRIGTMDYTMEFGWSLFTIGPDITSYQNPLECHPCENWWSGGMYYCKVMFDNDPCGENHYYYTPNCTGELYKAEYWDLNLTCIPGFKGAMYGYDVRGKCHADDDAPYTLPDDEFNLDMRCLDAASYFYWSNTSNSLPCAESCTMNYGTADCDLISEMFDSSCLATCDRYHPNTLDWLLANPIGVRGDCNCMPMKMMMDPPFIVQGVQGVANGTGGCTSDAAIYGAHNFMEAMSEKFRGGMARTCYEGTKVITGMDGCPVEWKYDNMQCLGMPISSGKAFDADNMTCSYDGLSQVSMFSNNMTMYSQGCVMRNDSLIEQLNARDLTCVPAGYLTHDEPDWKCFESCPFFPMTCMDAKHMFGQGECQANCSSFGCAIGCDHYEVTLADLIRFASFECSCIEELEDDGPDDHCDDPCDCSYCPPTEKTVVVAIFRDHCGDQSGEVVPAAAYGHYAFQDYVLGIQLETCYDSSDSNGTSSFMSVPTMMDCGDIHWFDDTSDCSMNVSAMSRPLLHDDSPSLLGNCMATPPQLIGMGSSSMELHCVQDVQEAVDHGVMLMDYSCYHADVLRAHDAALEASSFAMISGAECMATCQVEKTMSCESVKMATDMGGCAANCSTNFTYHLLASFTPEKCKCEVLPSSMYVVQWEFATGDCSAMASKMQFYNASTWLAYMNWGNESYSAKCHDDLAGTATTVGLDFFGCPSFFSYPSGEHCDPYSAMLPMGAEPIDTMDPQMDRCYPANETHSIMYTCTKFPPKMAEDFSCLSADVAELWIQEDRPYCTVDCSSEPMSCEEANMMVADGGCAESCDRQEVFGTLLEAGHIDCHCEIPDREMFMARQDFFGSDCAMETLHSSVAWPIDYVWEEFISPMPLNDTLLERGDCKYIAAWGVFAAVKKVHGCHHIQLWHDGNCVQQPVELSGGPLWPTSLEDRVCLPSGDYYDGMPLYEMIACVATYNASIYADLSCVAHSSQNLKMMDWPMFIYGDNMEQYPNLPDCAKSCLAVNVTSCEVAQAMFMVGGCAESCEGPEIPLAKDLMYAHYVVGCDCELMMETSSTSTSKSTASSATSTSSSVSTASSATSTSSSVSTESSTTASTESSTSTTATMPPGVTAATTTTTTTTQGVVDGSLELGFDTGSAEDFVSSYNNDTNGEVEQALQAAIAAPLEGIDAEDINITNVTVLGARRMLGRSLTGLTVLVEYTILVPPDFQGTAEAVAEALADNTAAADTIQQSLNMALPDFEVGQITVEAEVITTTPTTTATPDSPAGATRSARAAAVAIILALHKLGF